MAHRRQILTQFIQRFSCCRCVNRDRKADLLIFADDRYRDRNQAVEELAGVIADALGGDFVQLRVERIVIGSGSFRVSREGQASEQPLARRRFHVGQKQLTGRSAVQWQARADRQMDAVRPVGLHPVEIDDLVAVVHGGPERSRPALVDDDLLAELDQLAVLAPPHQPQNLAAIRAVTQSAPGLAQVACFDTAFHASQSALARTLPLPRELRDQGLQRYGFHGLSYEYVTAAVPSINDGRLPERLIVAHLGNGASLCAVRDGKSAATSMGFSTLDGLLMGTRRGGIDPGVLLHLMREQRMDEAALSDLLYNRSGLLGVIGESADMQTLLASDRAGAAEAVALFCCTVARGIGSMAAALQGIDALVFTGGIGEHASPVRQRGGEQLAWLGVNFDVDDNIVGDACSSRPDSAVSVWVIPTSEEQVIARHTLGLVKGTQHDARCCGAVSVA